MTKTDYRYFAFNVRGFAGEDTYIRVRPEEVEAVESAFKGWSDRQFDLGYTNAACGWTNAPAARREGQAADWSQRGRAFEV